MPLGTPTFQQASPRLFNSIKGTPSGTPRTPKNALTSSKATLALVFMLEIMACVFLVFQSPEDGPFSFGKRGRILQEVQSFPPTEFDIPIIPRVAPEYGYFTLDTCSTSISCNKTLTITHTATFVNALQLCLGSAKCGGVLFDPVQKQATLCTSLIDSAAANKKSSRKELNIGQEELQCIASAQKKPKAPPVPCPGDRHQCLVFEALELQSGFNDQAQLLTQMEEFHEMWGAVTEGFRAYNPGIVEYNNKWYTTLRLSNWTYCPWAGSPMAKLREDAGVYGVHSATALCELQMPTASIRLETCKYLPMLTFDPLVLPSNATQTFSKPHLVGKGVEDIRPFVHDDKLRLSGNRRHILDEINLTQQERTALKLKGKESSIVVDIELNKDFSSMTRPPHGFQCAVESSSHVQKNWMPLSVDNNNLYYVTRLSPLIVVKVEIGDDDNTCSTVYEEQGPLASYEARTLNSSLRGSSPFIPLDDSSTLFLGLAHSRQDGMAYHHHFVVLQRSAGDRFELVWVSEAFRLPRSPDFAPKAYVAGVQFAMSIARYRSDLVLSYGDGDCEAHVAVATDFFGKLNDYMRDGLRTYKIDWKVDMEQVIR